MDEYETQFPFTLHGLTLGGDDAARLNLVSITVAMEAVDEAMRWLGSALRDAAVLGANMDQLTSWTGYEPETVTELLLTEFEG